MATARHGSTAKTGRTTGAAKDSLSEFQNFLKQIRPEVERRLTATWQDQREKLGIHGPEVVAMLEAAHDLTSRGGKRFRAALLAIAYSGVAPKAPLGPALDAGTALELLQTYLLIQDDWMDGDDLRRGGPSVHAALARAYGSARLGDSVAMLASDLTWGMAIRTLTTLDAPVARVRDVVQRMCDVHQDVVIGQTLDVFAHAEAVEAVHTLKTGSYTVRGPLTMGAALAGASADVIDALERFAEPLGIAFQLRDDLLGVFGTTAETGKPRGGDLRAGKRSAVIVEAERLLDSVGKKALAGVFGRDQATSRAMDRAIEVLDACGAREAVSDRLRTLVAAATSRAKTLPLEPRARILLAGAATALLPQSA